MPETDSNHLYDEIGIGYSDYRRPDPRIARSIAAALGDVQTVLNVGAGAGSYEPDDRTVIAVEPSVEMIRQRKQGGAPVVQALAERLPFADAGFDATLAILTVHHWQSCYAGLEELVRVAADRVVILTFDVDATARFWLVDRYFPEIAEIDRGTLPSIDQIGEVLGKIEVRPLPIPQDCSDGFLGAYWRRPKAYLDARVRNAISVFSRIGNIESGLGRLEKDLQDGSWEKLYGDLMHREEMDLGYRLVTWRRPALT